MRIHRAWFVLAITFVALLVTAGLRSAPGVMIRPLELSMGWDRATISLSVAIGILFYGLTGPFSAALTNRIGLKPTMLGGLVLMACATFASRWMTEPWQFVLSWGIVAGVGSGAVAPVLAATVVNRWFAQHRGLAMGVLSASTATGALVFLPLFAWLAGDVAWRNVALAVSIAALAIIPIVWLLMPEDPRSVGLTRLGEEALPTPATPEPATRPGAIATLRLAVVEPMFWLLAGTFFVCGLTTNGLIGTHLIAYCGDIGIASVAAAGMLSMMGLLDIVGTTASGWLTDRYDPRKLLCIYYGLRGLSLIALPFAGQDAQFLTIFAIFYGLDWIATVPPTVALASRTFGDRLAPIVFGWIMVAHQLGAATAAFGAGVIRSETGSYIYAFLLAGAFGLLAAFAIISLARTGRRAAVA
ncbi:MFS transporter [Sphingobium sufflavum]|uniref:MFS transporter n=1 Tax=Sphingobium sufflavum TaxID=1129547 RepID=UPI001F40E524|nr:MFS transporter [Sphingobium sufflavum]MCE7797398.1 MFS transporter [Sphingobium sufflavum]